MALIGRLLRRISGKRARAHRRVDQLMTAYVDVLDRTIWRPVPHEKQLAIIDAILSGRLTPDGHLPSGGFDAGDERFGRAAETWLVALQRNSFVAANPAWLLKRLTEFTTELARWLVDPVTARLSPELIGRQLAYDLELSTQALRHTLEVLTPFTEELLASAGAEPEQRARLLGGLAEGFTDGARQRVLDEQMALAEAVDRAHLNQHETLTTDAGRFASSFEESDLGLGLLNNRGVIMNANPALWSLLGRPEGPVAGRTLASFVSNEEHARQVEQACLSVADTLQTAVLDLVEVGGHGTSAQRWASVTVTWIADPDEAGAGSARVVMADVTDAHLWHHRLNHAAGRDETTDLPNRQCLKRRLDDVLCEAESHDAVGLCVVGLDGIDAINEELGSEVGDNVVRLLANRLRAAAGGAVDMVARHDLATFCAVITDSAVWSRVDELVAHVDAWLGETIHVGRYELAVSPRIRIVRAADSGDTADRLLRRAEQTLEQPTAPGRRQAFIDPRHNKGEQWTRHLLADLPAGIDNQELELAYTPLVDPTTRSLTGTEAGVVWRHPEHGPLAIDHLLVLADEIGLDLGLTRWMLGKAADQTRKWNDSLGAKTPFVMVNVPRRIIRGDQLVGDVQHVLATSQTRPDLLRIGLSQPGSSLWHGIRPEHLTQLSSLGISVRLNDFGSDFEQFDLLPQRTFGGIAIPPGLTSRLGGTEPQHRCSQAITTALMSMAHTLGLAVTLQGVDSEEQLSAAQDLHAAYIQGRLAGPTLSPQEIHSRVQENAQTSMQALVEAS